MRILPATLSLSLSKFRQFLTADWRAVAALYALFALPAVVWRLVSLFVLDTGAVGYTFVSLAVGLLSLIGGLALLLRASAWLSDRDSSLSKSLKQGWSLLGAYIATLFAWGVVFLPLLPILFGIRSLGAASLDRNMLSRLQGIVLGAVSPFLCFFSGPLLVERGQAFFQNVLQSMRMSMKHAPLVAVLASPQIVLTLLFNLFDLKSVPTDYACLLLLNSVLAFLMYALQLCAFRLVSDGSESA